MALVLMASLSAEALGRGVHFLLCSLPWPQIYLFAAYRGTSRLLAHEHMLMIPRWSSPMAAVISPAWRPSFLSTLAFLGYPSTSPKLAMYRYIILTLLYCDKKSALLLQRGGAFPSQQLQNIWASCLAQAVVSYLGQVQYVNTWIGQNFGALSILVFCTISLLIKCMSPLCFLLYCN